MVRYVCVCEWTSELFVISAAWFCRQGPIQHIGCWELQTRTVEQKHHCSPATHPSLFQTGHIKPASVVYPACGNSAAASKGKKTQLCASRGRHSFLIQYFKCLYEHWFSASEPRNPAHFMRIHLQSPAPSLPLEGTFMGKWYKPNLEFQVVNSLLSPAMASSLPFLCQSSALVSWQL